MKKRILSIALALCLALALLPVSAPAAGTAEDYTVTLLPNLEGLEPIVFKAAEQGEIPFGKESLDEEYDHCISEMGFTSADLMTMNRFAAEASFLPENERSALLQALREAEAAEGEDS